MRRTFIVPRRPIFRTSPVAAVAVGSPTMQWFSVSPCSFSHNSILLVPLALVGPSSSPVIRRLIEP
ncbi:MAG: hypothetical protein WDN08_01965 [Rhizomicrobium sp.]